MQIQKNYLYIFFDLKELKQKLLQVRTHPEERLRIAKPLLDSLHRYGVIRLKNHSAEQAIVDHALGVTNEVLGQSVTSLYKYHEPEISSFRGLQLKNKDLKRVFTIGSNNNVTLNHHEELTYAGQALHKQLGATCQELLKVFSLIYEGREDGILSRKNMPRDEESLRLIHYPSKKVLEESGVVLKEHLAGQYMRLRPHVDYSLLSALPASQENGLYILPNEIGKDVQREEQALHVPLEKWIKVESEPGEVLIQPGLQMAIATKNLSNPVSATWHMVLADDQQIKTSRNSASFYGNWDSQPLPDYFKTLQTKGQETSIASYQFPERATFPVTSQHKLRLEKWLSEQPVNPKALGSDGEPLTEDQMKHTSQNLSQHIQDLTEQNPNLGFIL